MTKGADEVIIRAASDDDWRDLAAIRALPKVVAGTLRLPFESPETSRKLLENRTERDLFVVAELDGRIVGSASLHRQTGRRAHVAQLGMMVHDDYQGRGIGRALLSALIEAADNWLGLTRIELTVYVDNLPAIRLYEALGFVREGVLRSYVLRDGAYVDAFAMARLHSPPQLTA